MRALVVYESMHGNTRRIAEAIARGLRPAYTVLAVSVGGARYEHVGRYDLLVAGGPTHAHGMSRRDTRQRAISRVKADQPPIEPDAGGPSLRVWLDTLGQGSGHAAAFDTRLQGYPIVTGRASKGIAAILRQHGFELMVEPISFLVDRHDHLLPGEEERAERWGASLGETRPKPVVVPEPFDHLAPRAKRGYVPDS